MGSTASNDIIGVLENLPNVDLVTTYYKFHLLKDEDDNKFVDCAIAANAFCIVSHDKDFAILKNIDFPIVSVVNSEQFKQILGKWITFKTRNPLLL